MIDEIKKQLQEKKDLKYRDFHSSLHPGIDDISGIRIPELRKIAKNIIKNDWESFLKENTFETFELRMLQGMVTGYLKLDYDSALKYIENFIPYINSWGICDCFCATVKILAKEKEKTKKFLKKYLTSKKEYELRFAFVILLTYFIDSDLDFVLDEIKKFNHEAYYSKMAAAWCLSICFVKNYKKTLNFIKNNSIHSWVLRKGITKAIESYRINKIQKEELKKLRQVLIS